MYLEDLPPAEAAGSSDDNPLILPNITARQFRNFLSMVLGLLVVLFSSKLSLKTNVNDA